MHQYPSLPLEGGAPALPYPDRPSNDYESFSSSSAILSPPDIHAEEAHGVSPDIGMPFHELERYLTNVDQHQSCDHTSQLLSNSTPQRNYSPSTNVTSNSQTVSQEYMDAAMWDDTFFGNYLAATSLEALQPTEPLQALTNTEQANVDFNWQDPFTTTEPLSRPHMEPFSNDSNDNDAHKVKGELAGSVNTNDVSHYIGVNTDFTTDGPGGSQQFQGGEDTKQSQTITSTNASFRANSQTDPQTTKPTKGKRSPKKQPRKPRAKRQTADEEASAFELPGPDYDFAVDDVFLDPKPGNDFGKHDPTHAKKLNVATKKLKEETLQLLQIPHVPGHQQMLWSPPLNDHSIPVKLEHDKICFDLLVKAISYSGIEVAEVRDTTEFVTRWVDRTFYDNDFVQVLARQVLDALINVHINGWTYYVQDPAFRNMYYKTRYFTFRDRFNLTALILKHSKTTCEDLLKGQRLYDVVGNSYHLETRVASNKKANRERAIRLAAEKVTRLAAEEVVRLEAEKSEKAAAGQTGTKRARDADMVEESLSDKRQKVNGGTHYSVDAPDAECVIPSRRYPAGVAGHLEPLPDTAREQSAGPPTIKKASRKKAPPKVTAALATTGERPSLIVKLSIPIGNSSSSDTLATAAATEPKGHSEKRSIEAVDGDTEPPVPIAKKLKTGPRAKAPMKGKSKANSTAPGGDGDADFEMPVARGRGRSKPASRLKITRTSARLKKSAVVSSALSASAAGLMHGLDLPE